MDYNYDPELKELLELLPDSSLSISDPVQARAGFQEMTAQLNADIDRSGVNIEERNIPGPAGAPEVAIRIYTPREHHRSDACNFAHTRRRFRDRITRQ